MRGPSGRVRGGVVAAGVSRGGDRVGSRSPGGDAPPQRLDAVGSARRGVLEAGPRPLGSNAIRVKLNRRGHGGKAGIHLGLSAGPSRISAGRGRSGPAGGAVGPKLVAQPTNWIQRLRPRRTVSFLAPTNCSASGGWVRTIQRMTRLVTE